MLPQNPLANPVLGRPKRQTKLKSRKHLEVYEKVLPSIAPSCLWNHRSTYSFSFYLLSCSRSSSFSVRYSLTPFAAPAVLLGVVFDDL